MLLIFCLAITPWSVFHHHQPVAQIVPEKHCTHHVHVQAQKDNCLICTAHFEKSYFPKGDSFVTYLHSKAIIKNMAIVKSAYAVLISTSLRGPPTFSSL
jgi:hypothetical protein